jgi:hypothetical protein
VVLALADLHSGFEARAAPAEALSDALGELIGKTLEKPTARSVGKLFQKYLTNRPAWIEDGDAVAVLRKIPGHDANKYRIDISIPGQSCSSDKSGSTAGGPQGANSDFPDIDESPSDETGKVGKEGNVSAAGRREESVIPAQTIGSSAADPGKVGKDGNVSTAARWEKTVNPEETTGEPSGWRARI